jgi:hypothetical protein
VLQINQPVDPLVNTYMEITKDLIDTYANNNLQIDKREPSKTCRNLSTDIVASEITV